MNWSSACQPGVGLLASGFDLHPISGHGVLLGDRFHAQAMYRYFGCITRAHGPSACPVHGKPGAPGLVSLRLGNCWDQGPGIGRIRCSRKPALTPDPPEKHCEIFFPNRRNGVRAMPARLIGQRVNDRFPMGNPLYLLFQNPQLRRVDQVVGKIKG